MAEDWRGDLEIGLAPFLAALRHKPRMRFCPAYTPPALRRTGSARSLDGSGDTTKSTATSCAECLAAFLICRVWRIASTARTRARPSGSQIERRLMAGQVK